MRPILKIFSALLLLSLNLEALPLRVLAWDDDIAGRKLAVAYGEKSITIGYMHPSTRTEAIKVPADAATLRIEALDLPAVEEKFPSAPLKIPKGVKNPLVLLLPDKKASAGLRTLVIEDDLSALAWGSTSLINATGKPLVFRYGDKGVSIKPDWKAVQVKPGGDTKSMQVKIYLADNLKKAVYSAVWTSSSGVRKLVFLVPNPDPSLGLVAFKFINEKRVVVEAAESRAK
jgi:hypothetical protein